MEKRVFVFGIFLLLLGFVSAEITVSEPSEVYNLGDRLYVSTEGLVGAESGNLDIELICGNQTVNLVRIPARAFSAEEEQTYSIPYKVLNSEDLEVTDVNNLVGSCQITASLGSYETSTKTFTITNEISVNAKLNKVSYDPAEPIQLTVEAIKANGQPLNGFVQGLNATDFFKAIEGGTMSETFSMSETAEAGKYVMTIIAYDQGSGGKLNQGTATLSFLINQVPSSVIPSLSTNDVTPGEELKVGVDVFDQSGKEMKGKVSVRIVSPALEETEKIISSGDNTEFAFATNATPGTWKLRVFFGDLIGEEREFQVLELQQVDFDITDSVLTVKNVGNTLYNKTIEVGIGEDKRELELKIGVGEIRKFNLKAPQGEYDVTVGDGQSSINRQVLLTGNAISIKDLERVGIFKGYSIVWIFLIIVLALAGGIFFYRYKKTKTLGGSGESAFLVKAKRLGALFKSKFTRGVPKRMKEGMGESMHFTKKSPAAHSLDSKLHSSEDKSLVDFTPGGKSGKAESALVLKGEKYPSSVIAISIKNYATINKNSRDELTRIVNETKATKGLVDWRGEFIFIVYSPVVTKTYHNEQLAAKAAFKLLSDLQTHNKKFNDPIEFNIALHSGELLASKSEGKLKYTSLGNTISLAKRMSDADRGQLLISDDARKKMLRDLKVEKHKEIGGHKVFVVKEIKNKEASEAKLKELLKRMD